MAAATLERIPITESIPAETTLRVFRRMLAYYVEERLKAFAKLRIPGHVNNDSGAMWIRDSGLM